MARWRQCRSSFQLSTGPLESILDLSGCCPAAEVTPSDQFSPPLLMWSSTRLPWQSSCSVWRSWGVGGDEGSQWKKPQHKCVGKAEAKCQPSSRSETQTIQQLELVIQSGWNSLSTDSVCSPMCPKWPLTTLVSHARRDGAARPGAGEERCFAKDKERTRPRVD